MVVSRTGHVGFVTTENEKLTGVEVRPDSLVRLERETGWAVDTQVKSWLWCGIASRRPRRANSCERDACIAPRARLTPAAM
jgi:hypothetical protein